MQDEGRPPGAPEWWPHRDREEAAQYALVQGVLDRLRGRANAILGLRSAEDERRAIEAQTNVEGGRYSAPEAG